MKRVVSLVVLMAVATTGGLAHDRCAFWLDLYRGEAVTYEKMVDDLAGVRVVYVGERHTLDRHHDIQQKIVESLTAAGRSLILGLEQMEVQHQSHLDGYNRGDFDFDELARRTNWAKGWKNYEDYRGVIEAAHEGGGLVVALNAPAKIVKAVGRGGLDKLAPELRRQLPRHIDLESAKHRRLVKKKVQVHANLKPGLLDAIYEAQACRDETMAATLCSHLRREKERMAVVVCGSGHCSYGLGIPERVRRRMGPVKERIIHATESGDLVLSAKQKAMARDVTISHGELRFLNVPIADYMHVVEPKPEE